MNTGRNSKNRKFLKKFLFFIALVQLPFLLLFPFLKKTKTVSCSNVSADVSFDLDSNQKSFEHFLKPVHSISTSSPVKQAEIQPPHIPNRVYAEVVSLPVEFKEWFSDMDWNQYGDLSSGTEIADPFVVFLDNSAFFKLLSKQPKENDTVLAIFGGKQRGKGYRTYVESIAVGGANGLPLSSSFMHEIIPGRLIIKTSLKHFPHVDDGQGESIPFSIVTFDRKFDSLPVEIVLKKHF